MTISIDSWGLLAALIGWSAGSTVAAPLPPPSIAGEVRALQAQPIYTPASLGGAPIALRYFVPDGAEVTPGEVLLRVDPGQSASRLQSLIPDIAKAEAIAAKDIAERQVKAVDAELALADADANLAKARIDAVLPRALISALDFDRYKGELERTEHDFVLKQRELRDAREAVSRRRRDADLELERMRLERQFHEAQLAGAEVRAERAGIVLHALDPRTGQRFDEGSTSFAGLLAGEVVSMGNMAVRAYALETERHHFAAGAQVTIDFDALPGCAATGRIETISGAPEPRPVWGEGHYFTIDILLDAQARNLPLLPGMSARVRAPDKPAQGAAAPATGFRTTDASLCANAAAAAATIHLEGEVIATRTAPLMPPALQDVWQLNIAELVPEGSAVKAGDIVLRFEVGDLSKQLLQNDNTLGEKLREREQSQLVLAARERDEALVTAEARAALDKALRKVAQPQDAIKRVDYQKLLIERTRCEKRMQLLEERERLAAEQRSAERKVLDVQIERLEREVSRLKESIATLSVRAPISGMMLHRSNFQGEKFAVASQVWRGMSVAEIPDTTTLAVRAALPERELRHVATGNSARVRLEGGGTLSARVAHIGRSVRSKSRVEPIPIVELVLEFERAPRGVRPGQQVQVQLEHVTSGDGTRGNE